MQNPISLITRFLFPPLVQKDLMIATQRRGQVSEPIASGIIEHLNPDAEVVASGVQMPVKAFAAGCQDGSTCLYSDGDGVFFVGNDDAGRGYIDDSTGLRANQLFSTRLLAAASKLLLPFTF